MHRRLHGKKNGIFSITKDTMSALLNLLKARQRRNTGSWTTSYSTTIAGKQLLWRFCGIQLQSGSSTFWKISRWTIIKPILVPTLKANKTFLAIEFQWVAFFDSMFHCINSNSTRCFTIKAHTYAFNAYFNSEIGLFLFLFAIT